MPFPANVNGKLPMIFPLRLRVPELVALIVAPGVIKVILPLKDASVPVFVNAPAPETPVPARLVIASAVPRVNPFKSSVAPDAIVVPAFVVPNGVLTAPPFAPSFKVPTLIVVTPE